MKKFMPYLLIFLLFIIACLIFNLSYGKNSQVKLSSQIQYNYFSLKVDRYFAECYFGLRENNFEYDGISTEKVEYGIFKINLYGNNDYAKKINVNIKINNNEKIYILEKNPFDNTFMCDIGKIYSDEDTIEILVENVDDDYNTMQSISADWKINHNLALKNGFNYLKKFIFQNKNNCECYLTIIYNNGDAETSYFWAFKVITTNSKSKLVVITPDNGDIVLMSWI